MKASAGFTYAALALTAGAMLHIGGLIMGPSAIRFLGAPPNVVQSVADKTFYGPAITLAIAALLAGLALLSWRARRISNRLSRAILWIFGFIFTLRGLLIFMFVPAIMGGRDGGNVALFWFHVGASCFVLTIGLALVFALFKTRLSTA